jgi:fatty-acyl-CoA synthase
MIAVQHASPAESADAPSATDFGMYQCCAATNGAFMLDAMSKPPRDPVYDWLAYYAEFDPGRLAAVDLATGRWLTYGQLDERATRLATGLRDQCGIAPGDRVGFLAQNSTDHFETLFACWKLGAIFVPLNWRLAAAELRAVIDDAEPGVIIHDEQFAPQLDDIPLRRVVRRAPAPDCEYERLIAGHEPVVRMQDATFDSINMLIYTSGTTGRPKGVIYTHRMMQNIVLHAALHARLRAHARTLTYSPLFHSAGLCALTTSSFQFGAAVFVMRQWDTRQCLALLTDATIGITHTVGVPTTYILLSQLPEFETATFPALEVAAVGAAPVPHHLLEAWERRGLLLSQSYGMTEAFSVSFCPPERAHDKVGSAGHALMHVEVRIADADGVEVPRGTRGEILVRGPGVTPGYWRNPQATQKAFTADGWLRSGDAGYMTDDGTIYVVDRIKDMYISGGENVYPAEIEDVIDSFDEVSACAVVGIPDRKWGEVGCAFVQLRRGCQLAEARVLQRCEERLARYKSPHYVVFLDKLPLSAQGKVLKHELRRMHAQGRYWNASVLP